MRKFRKYLLFIVALLVVGYFLYQFRNAVSLKGFRWSMVGESLHHARLSLLALALAVIYLCYAVRALRWMQFCRWLGVTHFGNVFSATLMGFACIFLLGRAGEPIRPVLIARKDSLSTPGMFGVYVLERIFDVAATVVLAVFALLFFERAGLNGSANDQLIGIARSAGVALSAILVVVIVFLVYFRHHGGAWLAEKLRHSKWRTGWREKVALLLEGFSEGLQGIRTWNDLAMLSLYTVVHWVLVITAYVLIVRAFPGTLSTLTVSSVALVLAFALVGSAVQAPAVGGGSQAASFLVLTLIFDVQPEPAAVATIVLWLICFAGCCLVGVPLLFREGWSMGELRRIAQTEEQAEEAHLLAEAEHADKPSVRPR
jgi:hypothetical protein